MMGSYKEDSDRFHEMQEQRERDLAEAETWMAFIDRLKRNGVDVDAFARDLNATMRGLDRLNVRPAVKTELILKAIKLRIGEPE